MNITYKFLVDPEKNIKMEDTFDKQKRQLLNAVDLSRKGSIDKEIVPLVTYLNSLENFCTTSSCSGRIIVFEEKQACHSQFIQKKGCVWLYTSHTEAETKEVVDSLLQVSGNAVFKFEPFVLHVQCRTLEDAQLMLSTAVASGFRNSGISVSNKGKFVVGIRSTHSLEVPLSQNQQLLVSDYYIGVLVELANTKLHENFRRIQRFFDNLKEALESKQKDEPLLNRREKKKLERKRLKEENMRNHKSEMSISNKSSLTSESESNIINVDSGGTSSDSHNTCSEIQTCKSDLSDEDLENCFLFNS